MGDDDVTGNRDDTEANRDQILDAATRVFAEKGFNSARVDDVVASSGLSKGTVYWHYKSKDGLLTAVMRRFLSRELNKLNRLVTSEASVEAGLIAFVDQLIVALKHLGPLMQITLEFYAIALRKEWARKLLREYYAEYRSMLCAIIQAGIDSGEFRPVQPEETAIALSALLEGMILVWVIDDETVQIDQHTKAAVRLVLEGLKTRPRA